MLPPGSSDPGLDSAGHLDLQEIAKALNVKEFASTDNWHFKLESQDTPPAFTTADKDFTGWHMEWDAPPTATNAKMHGRAFEFDLPQDISDVARFVLYNDQGVELGHTDIPSGATGGSTQHIAIPGAGALAPKYQVKLMDVVGNLSPALELTPPALTVSLVSDAGSDDTDHITKDAHVRLKVGPEYVFKSGDTLLSVGKGSGGHTYPFTITGVDPNTHELILVGGKEKDLSALASWVGQPFPSTNFEFYIRGRDAQGRNVQISQVAHFTATVDHTPPPSVTDASYSSTHKIEFKLPTDVSDVDRVVFVGW